MLGERLANYLVDCDCGNVCFKFNSTGFKRGGTREESLVEEESFIFCGWEGGGGSKKLFVLSFLSRTEIFSKFYQLLTRYLFSDRASCFYSCEQAVIMLPITHDSCSGKSP